MSYFSIPSVVTDYSINDNINLEQRELNDINVVINLTMNSYINKAKMQIDSRQIEWDIYKKYTNTYEYIHTHVPNTKYSICKMSPLSRSFYKMIEIFKTMKFSESLPLNNCKTFHFAEGPGGFIEALIYLRENPTDKYYGMTLDGEELSNIPGWKKSQGFLDKNKNVSIWPGKTGDGDMMKSENLIECYNQHKSSCDIVTCDGGFDFSMVFKYQEVVSSKLVFAQCAYAFSCQKKGGNFVLKMFDTYTPASIDIIYMLACAYEKVYFFKPHTSRQANSEKYIVCKNFKLEKIRPLIISMYDVINSYKDDKYPYRFLKCAIPYNFICAVQEINAILGQSQIENISTTINIIDYCSSDRLENLTKNHISKCISWCQKFKMPYNKLFQAGNLFLTNSCLQEI